MILPPSKIERRLCFLQKPVSLGTVFGVPKQDPAFAVGGPRDRPTAQTEITGPMREPVAQVRGVLAERVVVSTLDPFLSLKALAGYSGLSVRKLREYLDDPAHPLPCYRVGGKILVRRSEFDRWIATYRTRGHVGGDHLVSDVLSRLR